MAERQLGLANLHSKDDNPEISNGEAQRGHTGMDPSRQAPSPMARKFLAASNDEVWEPDIDAIEAYERGVREGKETYFFYGTLMDRGTLQRILGCKETLELKLAYIRAYHIEFWGPHPALLDGPAGNNVHGMACEVQGAEMKDRLAAYETENHREAACIIVMDDGTEVDGNTFMWAGHKTELKAGSFDLKDWQMNNILEGV